MTEKTRKKIVYLALVAAVIWGAYNFSGHRGTTEITAPGTIQPATAGPAHAHAGQLPNTSIEADRPWGSDPFRLKRDGTVSRSGPSWVLTGIIYNQTSPLAYINRKAVREGETIDSATVLKIERKSVTLKYQGNEFTIRVSRG